MLRGEKIGKCPPGKGAAGRSSRGDRGGGARFGIALFAATGTIIVGLLSILAIGVLAEPFLPVMDAPRSTLLAAIVIAPICEEVVFRGVIQRLLNRIIPPAAAIIIASALFAAAHVAVPVAAVAFPCGIVLGWAYHRTRTLAVPIAIHALNNALAWILYGETLRGAVSGDILYWMIYAACAVFLTINIIFVLRR